MYCKDQKKPLNATRDLIERLLAFYRNPDDHLDQVPMQGRPSYAEQDKFCWSQYGETMLNKMPQRSNVGDVDLDALDPDEKKKLDVMQLTNPCETSTEGFDPDFCSATCNSVNFWDQVQRVERCTTDLDLKGKEVCDNFINAHGKGPCGVPTVCLTPDGQFGGEYYKNCRESCLRMQRQATACLQERMRRGKSPSGSLPIYNATTLLCKLLPWAVKNQHTTETFLTLFNGILQSEWEQMCIFFEINESRDETRQLVIDHVNRLLQEKPHLREATVGQWYDELSGSCLLPPRK